MLALGKVKEAAEWSAVALKRQNDTASLTLAAHVSVAGGRDDIAEKLLAAAQKLEQPRERALSAELRTLWADLQRRHGKIKEARELLESSLSIQRRNPAALRALARLELDQGNAQAALEAYSQASTISTQAADAASLANAIITHDNNVNLQAMQMIWQAQLLPRDHQDREFLLHQASVFYLRQASDEAYTALGLPEDARKMYKESGIESIPEEELLMVQRKEYNPDYYLAMYSGSDEKYKEAKVKFDEGSHANNAGDYFSLAGVYYALSLFFAGIGLVFKTGMRWWFFSIGFFIFVATTIYMFTLEWA
jgi:tetratricopeptide (TPR) repeat protein